MSVIDKIKEGKYGEAIQELKNGAINGVKEAYNEYHNKRETRDTQVGKRQNKRTKKETVKVAKIPIPFQRKIVQSGSVFLFGSPVKLVPNDSNKGWEAIDSLWTDLRMDSLLLKFCKSVKSETEAAIIFYPVKKDDGVKIKARLLNYKAGRLYTNFDEYGDLVAFGWEYTKKDAKGEDVKLMRVWTAEKEMEFNGETLVEGSEKPNLFKKIPVVYLNQDVPEWEYVKEMIDRFEMSFSKFCDTNDYFAHPMYKMKGKVESMAQKDETGKAIRLPIHETQKGNIIEADVDFLTWEQAPEAIKLEFETNKGLIYGLSDTPDLSFDNVKGIGNVSGIALKLMFMAPMMKAYEDQGDYTVAISRIINVMKAGIANITKTASENDFKDLYIETQYTSILPDNILEVVQMLTEANGNKPIMSQKTAVASNPLVQDNEEEMKQIEEESQKDKVNNLGETFNI